MTPARDPQPEVQRVIRDAAADTVKAYRDTKNNDWQQRIRDGKCDDGEMVQAFLRVYEAGRVEGMREGLERAIGIADVTCPDRKASDRSDPWDRGYCCAVEETQAAITTRLRAPSKEPTK